MLLQFCDRCGRPLSEGCLARGEAIERKGELICAPCIAKEQTAAVVRAAAQEAAGPLGHYEQAVWSCESCGIPVTALDLIEGRAARAGSLIHCARCSPAKPEVQAPAASAPRVVPRPVARTAAPRPTAPRPVASNAAEAYIAQAGAEQRRPILPIVMFAIVLPMFAISVYFAVTTQAKLNDAVALQNRAQEAAPPARRPQQPLEPERATPLPGNTSYTPPTDRPPPQREPERPTTPAKIPLPPGVLADLAGVEADLARPVIAQLQSTDRAEIWQGLIAAGSQRLIAARPYVRALLRDDDDQIRAIACRVTGVLADDAALPTLSRMADSDPAEEVRVEARKARDRMTGKAAREVKDMSDTEIEQMIRDLQRELERRRGRAD